MSEDRNPVDDGIALDILARYIQHVGNSEGVTFLRETEWTPEQWAIIDSVQWRYHSTTGNRAEPRTFTTEDTTGKPPWA